MKSKSSATAIPLSTSVLDSLLISGSLASAYGYANDVARRMPVPVDASTLLELASTVPPVGSPLVSASDARETGRPSSPRACAPPSSTRRALSAVVWKRSWVVATLLVCLGTLHPPRSLNAGRTPLPSPRQTCRPGCR